MSRLLIVALVMLLLTVTLAGCEKRETAPPPAPSPTPAAAPEQAASQSRKRESRVVVPPEVEGQWKAVKISVLDKTNNLEQTYAVDLGSEVQLGDSGLKLKALNFLPAFIMDGATMTSASNEPKNPAAQIIISEDGQELFRGWLFSLYPNTHAFQHPRYSFTLADFVPAAK